LKWALAIAEKNLGLSDPKLADSLSLLAAFYADLNRLEEAELLEKRALTLRKNSAQNLDLMGLIEVGLKKNSQAENLIHEALTALEKSNQPDPALMIHLWGDLERAYLEDQNLPEAQSCLEKALEVAQKNFSPDDPKVADAMEDLANFYRDNGPSDKAEPLYDSALKIATPLLGTAYDYQTLPNLKRLARLAQETGDFKSALDLWSKVLQVEKTALGSQHPQVAIAMMHMAKAEVSLEQKEKAKSLLKDAISLLENYFQPDHPLMLEAKGQLSELSRK
jgi:tetratricopeptide (TPR) repeat protein